MIDYYLMILEILNNLGQDSYSNEELALIISKAVREEIQDEIKYFLSNTKEG
jgi:hypothetical protein